MKLPSLYEDPLDEAGGVGLRPVYTAGKVSIEALKCAVIEAYEPEGASLDAKAAPAPTKGTASIKLASRAVEATTAKPEVLEP